VVVVLPQTLAVVEERVVVAREQMTVLLAHPGRQTRAVVVAVDHLPKKGATAAPAS